jgi:SAM-dependent methyltransferase
MSLADEYKRQFRWRDWAGLFASLPALEGRLILDLGCGVGDQAAELAKRGARVIGVDTNEDLLREARSRHLERAEFRRHDLSSLPDLGVVADGIWSSFTAAYFPELASVLGNWTRQLRPGGWVALTEIDDLFGHEPLAPRVKSWLDAYARDALASKRYDFKMGRKLHGTLRGAGFDVIVTRSVEDLELSFSGPARGEVLDAWVRRFDRMKLLRDSAGADFESFRQEFIDCLRSPAHRSEAKVTFCLATKKHPDPV